jgi:hypothetical protein
MASKKIEIIYDINGKPIDVAIDKTKNLQQQARLLTAELRRTKEGTAEFQLLSTKLGDVQDGLAATNAKSRDLFASLSLIPGPVGDLFGKLNGVIGLLKTFSSFSLKDLGFQLKETGNDILDIGKNLLGLKLPEVKAASVDSGSIKEAASATQTLASANTQVATSTAAAATQTTALTSATAALTTSQRQAEIASTKRAVTDLKYRDSLNELEVAFGKYTRQQVASGKITVEQGIAQNRLSAQQQYAILQTNGLATANMQLAGAETAETTATVTNTAARRANMIALAQSTALSRVLMGAFTALSVSEYAAATAAVALSVALKSIGIGILISLLSLLLEPLLKLIKIGTDYLGWTESAADATKKAADNTEKYTKALERNTEALNKNLQGVEYQTKKKTLLAQIEGKSAEDLLKITQGGLEQEKQLYSKQIGDLQALRAKSAKDGKLSAEEKAKVANDIDKKITEASTNYVKKRNDIEFAGLEYIKTIRDKEREEEKKRLEKIAADNIEADKMLLELKQNNAVQTLKTVREREDKELQIQAESEAAKVDALQISEEKKEKLKLQIFVKYGVKIVQLNQKRQDEDLKLLEEEAKKREEFAKKKQLILIESLDDQTKREKEQRQLKFNEDSKQLEEDKNFIAMSEKDKNALRLAMAKILDRDLKKIDEDKRKRENDEKIAKLDSDLRFLQITNEANKNSFNAYWNGRQELLNKAKERELAELDLTEAQKLAIEKKYAQLSKDLQSEKLNAYLGFISAGLAAVSNAFSDVSEINQMEMDQDLQKVKGNAEEEDKIKKKYFEKNKNVQIAQAIIGTLQGAIQAYQSLAVIPVVGPVLGAAAAAAALVFGYKKVALIKSTQYDGGGGGGSSAPASNNLGRNYGDGGMIEGPRHSNGGVPITAEGGEAVMTRGAVTMFAPLLSAMNQMGGGTSFSKGATGAARFDNPKLADYSKEQSPVILKTYVVSKDMQSEIEKQTRLKDLSTL